MNFGKQEFWVLLRRNLKHSIHYLHIFGVLTVLLDEMKNDLLADKEIPVKNFGILKLKRRKERRFRNVFTGKICFATPKNSMTFDIADRLKAFIKKQYKEKDSQTFPINVNSA